MSGSMSQRLFIYLISLATASPGPPTVLRYCQHILAYREPWPVGPIHLAILVYHEHRPIGPNHSTMPFHVFPTRTFPENTLHKTSLGSVVSTSFPNNQENKQTTPGVGYPSVHHSSPRLPNLPTHLSSGLSIHSPTHRGMGMPLAPFASSVTHTPTASASLPHPILIQRASDHLKGKGRIIGFPGHTTHPSQKGNHCNSFYN